jgi:hypothetical protein
VIETEEHLRLLEENRSILARHATRHDLSGIHEIDIGSRYRDEDTAMAARQYVVAKYGKPKGALFWVSTRKYADGDIVIELKFSLEEVPDADAITKYELMLREAADKFGGETPGWEIAVKPT